MNGYTFPSHQMADDRQHPPTIPSLTSLAISRPSSAASPNHSQLPPLANQHFPPSFSQQRHPNRDAPQLSHAPLSANALSNTEKPTSLSSIAPSHSLIGSQQHPQQQYGAFLPPYSAAPQHSFQPLSHQFPPSSNSTINTNIASTSSNGHAGQIYSSGFPQPPQQSQIQAQQQQQQQQTTQTQTQTQQQQQPSHQQQLPPFVEPSHQPNLLPPFNPQPPQQQLSGSAPNSEQRPQSVVGSQGRRGILPSAPGRAQAVGIGSDSKTALANATRGSDGKYACSYCSKVYLHLKHLKRHHLRHTGERPYQCYLCQETFCRSDILKRHFQKCSIRRGNPTGATHLTHAQAHLRRNSTQNGSGSSAPTGQNALPSTLPSAPPSSYRPAFGITASGPESVDSTRTSRSSSIVQRPGSGSDDRKSFHSGLGAGPHTANTSLNTSPSSATAAGDDRKYSLNQYGLSRDLPPFQESTHHHHHHHQHQQPQQHHLQQHQQHHPQQHNQAPQAPPQQFPGFYSTTHPHTATSSAPEGFHHLNYAPPNGYRYGPHNEPSHYPDQNQWSNQYGHFFQPGSNDPVMSYHQQ